MEIAFENVSEEKKNHQRIMRKTITKGNLSEIVRDRVRVRGQKTDFREVILNVYSELAECLIDNQNLLRKAAMEKVYVFKN